MTIHNTLQNQQGWPLGVPWAEWTGGHGSGAMSTMSLGWGGGTQAALTLDFNWFDFVNGAFQTLLGYPTVNPQGQLRRVVPLPHPLLTWMYATRISEAKGVQFVGKAFGNKGTPYAYYSFMRCTCLFEALPYLVYDDNTLDRVFSGNEFNRFVTFEYEMNSETISRLKGSFYYTQTSLQSFVPPGAAGPTVGTDKFQQDWSQRIPHLSINLTWKQVAENYLFNSSGVPSGIQKCLGSVNSDTFLGFPPGSCLIESARIIPVPAPIYQTTLGLFFPGGLGVSRAWDVVLPIQIFLPPAALNKVGSWTAGWNSAPWPASNFFYPIASDSAGNNPPYPSISFGSTLFGKAT